MRMGVSCVSNKNKVRKKSGTFPVPFLHATSLLYLMLCLWTISTQVASTPVNSTSSLKSSKDVIKAIQSSGINPPPIIKVGHEDDKDKDPLSPFHKFLMKEKIQQSSKPYAGSRMNKSSVFIRRKARQIINSLSRKSCFAKVICGLGNKVPSENTGLLNDYAYLVGELFLNSNEVPGATGAQNDQRASNDDNAPFDSFWDQFEPDNVPENSSEEEEEEDDEVEEEEEAEEDDLEHSRSPSLDLLEYKLRKKFPVSLEKRRIKEEPGDEKFQYVKLVSLPGQRPNPFRVFIEPEFRWRIHRNSRQLQQRQCRQLRLRQNNLQGQGQIQAKNQTLCPYNDGQLTEIVTKLRKLMRGEDLLDTITMTALGAFSSGMGISGSSSSSSATSNSAVGSIQRRPASPMNVVINLQQNFTLPQQQQHNQNPQGLAVIPLSVMEALKKAQQSSLVSQTNKVSGENETVLEYEENPLSTQNETAYYFVPIPPPSSTTTEVPIESQTTPWLPMPTTTAEPDPLEKLIGILHSVGYYKPENDNSLNTYSSATVVSPPVFPPKNPTPDNKGEDEDSEEDEEQETGKVDESRINRFHGPPRFKEDNDYVRIRTSTRTGRFHTIHHGPLFSPTPINSQLPILFKALRALSSIMRGGYLRPY